MTHEPTELPRPVLPYVSTSPQAADAGWEQSTEGSRLLVPPPPAWRRMLGPAIKLVLMTPIVASLTVLAITMLAAGVRSGDVSTAFLALILFIAVIALSAAGLWAGALMRLIRIGRNGQKPFVLQVSGDALTITPAGDDPLDAGSWRVADVADARVDEVSWSLFVRLARLQVAFKSGEAIVTYVPWPDARPLLPVEAELRRAMGLDRIAPTGPTTQR